MLNITDLTFRLEGKPIFQGATASIPSGHKVGLVGRNGAGKTTLLRLIMGELSPDDGVVSWPKSTRLGYVAQEAPGDQTTLLDWVLLADTERASLLAEAETVTEPNRIADIQIRLADIDAHSAPSRAAQILAGLGFDEEAQNRACSEFSGGWRMRVALAAVLFMEPELLLLDEPTNYLDLEGTLWLESYLKAYPHTVLMVSHDRDLLNRAVDSILHLDRGKLTFYTGGYDDFEETRREKQRLESKLKKKQDDERKHIQTFIDRFKAKASKATQAQSRVKALARMKPIASAIEDRVFPFNFPAAKKQLASPLIRLEEATAGYTEGQPVLRNLSLRIDHDDRIALLGQNGNGKSTFAKIVAGRLAPLTGEIFGVNRIEVGYFAQHQLDDLDEMATPYDAIAKLLPDATEAQKRARLGTYGFGADKANTKCSNLSGGEKARLLFMIRAFHGPNLLILDEPTNHLDVDSREQLIRALNEFEGAVILISHDRHLVEACADRLWIVADGTVKTFDGDMDDYRRLLLDARSGRKGKRKGQQGGDSQIARQDNRKQQASLRADLAPLKKAVTAAEQVVEKLTRELSRLDSQLGDVTLYEKDPGKAQRLVAERGHVAKRMTDAEQRWMAASDAYDAAAGVS